MQLKIATLHLRTRGFAGPPISLARINPQRNTDASNLPFSRGRPASATRDFADGGCPSYIGSSGRVRLPSCCC